MHAFRTLSLAVFAVVSLAATTTAKADKAQQPGTPVTGTGRSSVTYYDSQGGLHSTTNIPGGSTLKRGGSSDTCSYVASGDGTTYDGTPFLAGDTIISTRWVFSEKVQLDSIEAPSGDAIITDNSGPVPRRLLSIKCDSSHFMGTVWVDMNDPFWNPRPTAQQLRNDLQLIAPTVYTNPVVDKWGGLITRYPAWLAIHPNAWQPQRSPTATHRGWTIYLFTEPTALDFRVDFVPDPAQPSPAFHGTVSCIDPAHPGTPSSVAFPALPALPEQAAPGVNGPCMWTPPGPGTVTIQATITFRVTLWVNGFTEAQPDYTYTGPALTFRTGELNAVNTNH